MSETPVNMGFTEAPPTPSSPSPAPAGPTPFERDTARVAHDRAAIERGRAEAVAHRTGAEAAPQTGDRGDAGPVPSGDAIDGNSLRTGEQIKLVGKDGKAFSLGADDVAGLLERRALETQRQANMPADANGYEARLPEGFQVPEGVEIRIDPADAALGDLKAWAHSRGMSQSDFSDVLSIYAQRQAREVAAFTAARNAEVAKLGVNAGARIDAIANWWRSQTGDDGKALDTVLRHAPTAGTVHALERLMSKFINQGASGFNRVPEAGGPPATIDGWDRMTFEQRRFAQEQRRR